MTSFLRALYVGVALFTVAAAFPRDVEAQRRCVKGKPCGNTCIAMNRTCRVGTPSAPPTARTPTTPPASTRGDTAATAAAAPWVASSRGSVYYRNGCSGGNQLAVQNRIYFKTEEEAQAAGYRRSTARGC